MNKLKKIGFIPEGKYDPANQGITDTDRYIADFIDKCVNKINEAGCYTSLLSGLHQCILEEFPKDNKKYKRSLYEVKKFNEFVFCTQVVATTTTFMNEIIFKKNTNGGILIKSALDLTFGYLGKNDGWRGLLACASYTALTLSNKKNC